MATGRITITPALREFWNAIIGEGDFTYDDIKARGGPSQPTLTKIAKGAGSLSVASARSIEDAVGLERGSIREVASGGIARWKPEGIDDGERLELSYFDRPTQTHRSEESLEDGYVHALFWAHQCWKAGADRELYHQFGTASVRLYGDALRARDGTPNTPKGDLDLAASHGSVQPSATVGDQATAGEESQVNGDDDPR